MIINTLNITEIHKVQTFNFSYDVRTLPQLFFAAPMNEHNVVLLYTVL
jgi:hypothetical protein